MSVTHDTDHDPCRPWLIDALYDMVHRSAARPPRLAEFLRCPTDLLLAYATPPDQGRGAHRCFPYHDLVPLAVATQNWTLIDATETQLGRTAFLPGHYGPHITPQQAGHVLKNGLNVLQALTQGLGQGQAPAAVGKALVPLVDELLKQLGHFKHELAMREAAEG